MSRHMPRPKSHSECGILGPHPAQSFCSGSCFSNGYCATDIDHAMHTLSLSSPDEQFYMDTGATSYMTHSQGIFSHYSPLKHHFNNAIIVRNGDLIPILGHGHVSIPSPTQQLNLTNVLHAPKLIKNSFQSANLLMIIMFLLNLIPSGFL